MQIEVFRHSYYYLVISINVLNNVYLQKKKSFNVKFLFLLRIMVKHKILWQEFLLVQKCIHVMAWVSWISLFLAYLRYLILFYQLWSVKKLHGINVISALDGGKINFETFTVTLFPLKLSKRLNSYDRQKIFLTDFFHLSKTTGSIRIPLLELCPCCSNRLCA